MKRRTLLKAALAAPLAALGLKAKAEPKPEVAEVTFSCDRCKDSGKILEVRRAEAGFRYEPPEVNSFTLQRPTEETWVVPCQKVYASQSSVPATKASATIITTRRSQRST